MKTLSFHSLKVGRSQHSPLIEIENLAFTPGVHLVVAPNGYGKTSFLQTLAGVLPPLSGKIRGDDVQLDPERDVLYVSEYLTFPKFIYPSEWIEHISGISWQDQLKVQLKPWIDGFSLAPQFSSYLGRISQGERRKVTWLAGHASTRPILLMDEPLDGLDLLAIKTAREMISSWKEQKRIVILVAHQLAEVLDLCDQAWLIRDQKLIAWTELAQTPAAKLSGREFSDRVIEFYTASRAHRG
jgi:ABC-2 type transport system ATP-binding protein